MKHPAVDDTIASLAAVTWDFPLVGRTRGLTEAWRGQGRRALFIEPPHSHRSFLRSALTGRPREHDVIRPSPVLSPVRWWPRVSRRTLRWMMHGAASRLRKKLEGVERVGEMTAVVISPVWAEWLDRLPFRHVIYDCIDSLSVHAPDPGQFRLFQTWERKLVARCDGILVTAEPLQHHIESMRRDRPIAMVRNAVDFDRFASATGASRPADLPPSDAARPIVGFVGALFEWIDWPLIEAAAGALPNARFVFIGPQNQPDALSRLTRFENIQFLGPRPHSTVPAYVAAFDVCWAPFCTGEIALAANPVKIYEYLALGKAVVTTPIGGAASFGACVQVGTTHTDVIRFLQESVASLGSPAETIAAVERRAFARANSWAARAREISEFIATLQGR